MGGLGSGPTVRSDRELVENCLIIDVNQILRYGAGDGRAKVLSWESQGRERASATCRLSGGRLTVLMVGTALKEIRDKKLYRETHGDFGQYCQERWGWQRKYANKVIAAAGITSGLAPNGAAPPANEAQARPLTRLPEPAQILSSLEASGEDVTC